MQACPFCRSKPEIVFKKLYMARCPYRSCGITSPGFIAKGDAEKWWNRRRLPNVVQAVLNTADWLEDCMEGDGPLEEFGVYERFREAVRKWREAKDDNR